MLGSEGYPSIDEMPYFAEMLKGQIELVDLESPDTPMTTYAEHGPILFGIAHCNIATDDIYICGRWVLINPRTEEPGQEVEEHTIDERFHVKKQ